MRLVSFMIVLASLALGAPAMAAEPSQPKPATPPAAAPAPAEKSAEKAAEKSSDEKAAETAAKVDEAKQADEKSAAKPPADGKASPQRFIPSEQVRADFDVSFPIDI